MTPMPPHVFTVQSQYHGIMEKVKLATRKHRLTPEAGLMVAFLGNDALSMTEIIKKRYYIGYNPTYNIRILEQDGFIERKTARYDARMKTIRLTPKGKELADQIRRALGGEAKREAA